ncbi:MAG TPA: PilZ domain-containing protein, partial [archaeon]|nr:PilZ domain-containing protein [archaeon]
VGSGRFFEKQTVERFIRAMRDARVEQGFLAASGSFTVPAQRMAKEHQITLIGRDQLVELLSMGAGSEYFTRQLEQSHARLEEAKETLRQYAAELDTLRRQRNEASWHLGEERATSAKLEAKLEELEQQVRRYDTDLQRWEQEAAALRKQWEESQWYLGEARERGRYLESQVSSLQEPATRVEAAERERDAAAGSLSEERAKSTSLAARLEELERELEASRQRSRGLEETFARLQEEMAVYRTLGERRHAGRIPVPDTTVELLNGGEEPAASASLRDLSATGLGLETDREVPEATLLRLRVRVPGREPLESKARLVWQHPEESAGRYRSGCRFVWLPAATRAALQELLTQAPRA